MKNKFVADILYQIADLLDIKGDLFFKTRAYRMAAQKIETMDKDIEILTNEHKLHSIPGIGDALAKKIEEIVETGKLEYLDHLKREFPEELLSLLELSGLGPKKVGALFNKLGISSIEELKQACNNGNLRDLDGFGEITERNILRSIKLREKTSGRVLLNVAFIDGNNYLNYLKKFKEIEKISIAGSLRRMKETIGDIDILATSKNPDAVMDYFVKYNEIQRVLMKGVTKSSVLLNDNIQVDLRVVDNKSYGAALQYFTGSKEHNVSMRGLAIKKGYKLNEYGLFNKENNKYIAGKSEIEIYNTLGLSYIEPELRENQGEISLAKDDSLPNLVKLNDIKGDFHIHSNYSDGNNSIFEMASMAQNMGYSFACVTDHSQSLKIAGGLSEEKINKKIQEIDELNKKFDNFKILIGTECDIKTDGSLDYSNKILKKFDVVALGIHTSFKMDIEEMTNRIISGMENEYIHYLAHPTGRMIGKREPYKVDIERIIETAKRTNTHLEINSFPDRLDLNDINIRIAKENKIKFVIGTDSHNIDHLYFMRYGVATARRGWLEKSDILNTYNIEEIEKILRDKR
jgi:DNA polymerase (family 10)